ncbi:hypothetical protein GCM10010269_53580 [Streptomyces humidus]|uniref:TIR domain-containing protein n=1 Tax=Streptomyces humidus TaxID=52259 RepID=A0A918G0P7_9ACTN|nr:toll/interleukin-1 receptor domain-containing protein [Streptomyces humidus]GGS07831.1 hypothetical protein GCM10010269_53580 [Streptomyces humidus]
MTGIFINYRTGDGEKAAVLIDNELLRVFGDDQVFRDRRAMEPGTHFPPELERRLEASTVVLVLIGHDWLKVTDRAGNRRIDDPKDYVHYEIRRSLDRGKKVVPLLLDGAPLPTREELPPPLAQLAEQQISQLSIPYAHEQMEPIVRFLKRHVPPLPAEQGSPQPGAAPKYQVGSVDRGVVGDGGIYIEHDHSGAHRPDGAPGGRPA